MWREANSCADHLADLGSSRCDNGEVVILSEPPLDLGPLLLRDVLGIGLDREVRG